MKTIWKFPLATVDKQTVEMPAGAKPLCVGEQDFGRMLWAEVDDSAPLVSRGIRIVGTGHPMEETGLAYIGTVFDGPFVWHVYDGGEAS